MDPFSIGPYDDEDEAENEEDGIEAEFEINIEPRDEVLAEAGISHDEFEAALMQALESREELSLDYDSDANAFPDLEETSITIRGKSYRLGNLAEIKVDMSMVDEEEAEDEEEVQD